MKFFFAYDYADRDIAQQFEKFFEPIKDIDIWHQDKILPGRRISLAIQSNLTDSDVVVFFLSADFLASDLYHEIEEEVIRLVKKDSIALVPILVRECLWEYSSFNKELEVLILPENQQALSSVTNTEAEIKDIVQKLLALAKSLRQRVPIAGQNEGAEPATSEGRKEWIARMKELLSNNRIDDVFDELDEVLLHDNDTDLRNTAILLKSRYNRAKNDQRLGIVTNENITIENSRILYSLLQLLDDIPEEIGFTDVEQSADYLDEVQKTSRSEPEVSEHRNILKQLNDKQQEIDSIFPRFQQDTDIADKPELSKELEDLQNRYENIKKSLNEEEITDDSEHELDSIRNDLIHLLEQAKTQKQKEQASSEKEDFETSATILVNEAKLIFVGDGEVGKTSILEKLRDRAYDHTSHSSTHGLDVKHWQMPLANTTGVSSFTFNIWDYGGQGRYRVMQPFFSTPKAIYLLVTVPQEVQKADTDYYSGIDYWVNFVEQYGFDADEKESSPLIFAMNKCDLVSKASVREQTKNLQATYSEKTIAVSCETGLGLDELQEVIESRLADTGMLQRSMPKQWVEVKEVLQEKSKTYDLIDYSEYLSLFEEKVQLTPTDSANIQEEAERLKYQDEIGEIESYLREFSADKPSSRALQYWQNHSKQPEVAQETATHIIIERKAHLLMHYLHAIGQILHFPKVPSLKSKLILKPDWVREFVYDLLRSPEAQGGILDQDKLADIFPGKEAERVYCIDILLYFDLCYSKDIDGKPSYFIPCLFPEEKPESLIELDTFPGAVIYECTFAPVLPPELISRLVAKQHRFIHKKNILWKSGALFSKHEDEQNGKPATLALLTENWDERKIHIAVVGEQWTDLIARLSNTIYTAFQSVKEHHSNIKLQIKETLRLTSDNKIYSLESLRNKNQQNILTTTSIKALISTETLEKTQTPQDKISALLHQELREMLFVAACPKDKQELRMNNEFSTIKQTLYQCRKEQQINLIPELSVAGPNLIDILSPELDTIHFSLHGSRKGYLLFVYDDREEYCMQSDELYDIFEESISNHNKIRLVCFSACHSLRYAEILAPHIQYTVGMNGAFPVEAAEMFAQTFYKDWFSGRRINFCFKQALRALKGKNYADQDGIAVHEMPQLFVDNHLQTFKI